MTNTIPKRGDVFFCQGSPDAIGSEERKTRPVVIIQNDAGNASSPTVIVANMTTNTSRRLYPMQFDIDLPGHSPSRVQCEQIRTVDKCRLRERIYTLTGEELRKLDDCLAVSFGMTRQAAQEAAHSAPEAQDDIFHELTRNGLSVAVCPLPVLNQVNITITDGKTVSMTRNVAPAGGIVSELLDMKDTPNGVPVATFALAVDRKFNREEADFIPVTTWRKTAEFVAKYFRKGQRVIIASGRIRVDPYTDKDGNKRTRFEVVADEVEFAESRRAAEDQPAGSLAAGYMENEGFAEIDGEDGELPF